MSHIPSYSTEIVRKAGAEEIIGCRNEAIRLFSEAFKLINEAKKLTIRATGSNHGGPDLHNLRFRDVIGSPVEIEKEVDKVRKSIDTGVWEYALDVLGLKNIMDATTIAKFREENEKNPAEVTMENLIATMDDLGSRRVEIFDQGVVNLFDKLDRTFKTNPSFRVEKKIILKDALDTSYSGWNHYRRADDQLRDLDRIFHLLDGKPPKDIMMDAAAVVGRVQSKPDETETDYMTFKLCANGNLHIGFKRPNLVAGINRIIAEHKGTVLGHDRRARKTA
jgi:hypothetical protein